MAEKVEKKYRVRLWDLVLLAFYILITVVPLAVMIWALSTGGLIIIILVAVPMATLSIGPVFLLVRKIRHIMEKAGLEKELREAAVERRAEEVRGITGKAVLDGLSHEDRKFMESIEI